MMKKLIILLLAAYSLFGQFKFQRSLDDRYTVLHLRGNGQAGSTTIPDVSYYGNTTTTYNGAAISSTQKKFGTSSMYFDGSNDYITIPNSSLFTWGTNDFTIDWWMYITNYNSYGTMFTDRTGDLSNKGGILIRFYNGNIQLYLSSSASHWDIASGLSLKSSPPTNEWIHCALVRNGTTFYFFYNGQQTATVSSSLSVHKLDTPISIANWSSQASHYIQGHFQEFRISKCARWTSNFTPPNKPY